MLPTNSRLRRHAPPHPQYTLGRVGKGEGEGEGRGVGEGEGTGGKAEDEGEEESETSLYYPHTHYRAALSLLSLSLSLLSPFSLARALARALSPYLSLSFSACLLTSFPKGVELRLARAGWTRINSSSCENCPRLLSYTTASSPSREECTYTPICV